MAGASPIRWISLDLLRPSRVSVSLIAAYALFKEACSGWVEDHASSLGAALAFYTVLPPQGGSAPGENDKRADPALRIRRY